MDESRWPFITGMEYNLTVGEIKEMVGLFQRTVGESGLGVLRLKIRYGTGSSVLPC